MPDITDASIVSIVALDCHHWQVAGSTSAVGSIVHCVRCVAAKVPVTRRRVVAHALARRSVLQV